MDLVGHGPWTIRVCREHGPLSEPLSRRCHCGLGANVVEVVPSTYHRGAVETLKRARLMAESPGRDPANVLRDVRGALGLDRNTPDPCGGR